MNVIADDTKTADAQLRHVHGLDKAALEHKLQDWGDWLEARLDFQGYPQSDAVAAALDGAGGGTPGHRMLCLDMPHRLWSIHQRILRLPEHEHAAVVVWYIPTLRQDKPRGFVVVDLDRHGDGGLPRRWMRGDGTSAMVHEVERELSRAGRFVICVQGIGRIATADTSAQAELIVKTLHRQDLLAFGRRWTTAEKAERLGITPNGLFSRLHRARLRLLGILPLV
jgi:hypothetical protein